MITTRVIVVEIEHINIDIVDKFAEEVINEVTVRLGNHWERSIVSELMDSPSSS